jgi:hypothetical protein
VYLQNTVAGRQITPFSFLSRRNNQKPLKMQFSVLSLLTLAVAVAAVPQRKFQQHQIGSTEKHERELIPTAEGFVKRQVRAQVEAPAMTNANGDVLPYNAAEVYKPSDARKKQ